ncbi:response regulator [Caballeronia sp. DA-9]|uniref:response regulator n=1 Tax=Caballeronia sp. DA-9 TaxID=3436237 RepID=UPI003F67ECA3
MNILILDDDHDLAASLAALAEKLGHAVTVACDCETARALAYACPFDFILADVELPDGDGRVACEGLRSEGASQDAYMIAVTGRADLGNDDFAAFDGYLHKPITFDLLERVLGEWQAAAGLPPTTPVSADGEMQTAVSR